MLRNVFFAIFSHFSIGLIFTTLFISLQEIGRFFFRVTSLIALGLILLALAANPFPDLEFSQFLSSGLAELTAQKLTVVLLLSAAAFISMANILQARFQKPLLAGACLFGLLGIACYSVSLYRPLTTQAVESVLFVVNGVGSSLLLGSCLAAMITGHWYLVQHKLSLAPLKNSSKVYLISVVLRIVFVSITVVFYLNTQVGTQLLSYLAELNFDGYLVLGRFTFGLFVPLLFGLMVWSAAKIRSTQSATGILYATIVLVLIGEAFGKYLYYSTGIPM